MPDKSYKVHGSAISEECYAYGGMTDAKFVETLPGRYGLTQVTTPDLQQPDTGGKVTLSSAELTNRLAAGSMTRAQVLRAVADSGAVGAGVR